MASQCMRTTAAIFRRNIYTSSVRCADKMMADPIEHATGIEKRELMAKAAGDENPFDMRTFPRCEDSMSLEKANEIPSAFEKRIVGCICNEDALKIRYMWLYKGHPTRCGCGYWFKLVEKAPL